MSGFWTTEKVDELKRLAAENNLSATEMATVLGAASRNAIIGKIHRIGLEWPKGKRVSYPKNGTQIKKPRVNFYKRKFCIEPELEVAPLPEIIEVEIPVEQHKTLFQLNEHTCRWPIGDSGSDGFFFCGAIPENKKPYCAFHQRKSINISAMQISNHKRLTRTARGRE